MRHRITAVYFPPAVWDKMDARGIDEDNVLNALAAGAYGPDPAPLTVGQWVTRDGLPDFLVLARDPASGMYLEIGFVLQSGNVARCYHAMPMRDSDRKRFERARR